MAKSKANVRRNLKSLNTVKIFDEFHFIDLLADALEDEACSFYRHQGMYTSSYYQIIKRLVELLGE